MVESLLMSWKTGLQFSLLSFSLDGKRNKKIKPIRSCKFLMEAEFLLRIGESTLLFDVHTVEAFAA